MPNLTHGLRASVVKIAKGDYAAKIFKGPSHIATVSNPGPTTQMEAMTRARAWADEYGPTLGKDRNTL